MRDDEHVFPDIAVVCDLDVIVDLGATADTGLVEGRAINGRVRPDLDIVFEHHAAAMRHRRRPPRSVRHIPKTISADHDAGLQDNSISD